MRKIAFLAAAAAALCTVACNKDLAKENAPAESPLSEERAPLEISIVGSRSETKGLTSYEEEDYSKVKTAQIFVFDGETLDVYASLTNTITETLSVRQGTKTIWVLVNAPEIKNITKLSQLKTITTSLTDNTSAFVMVGSIDNVTVPATEPVKVEVKRIVARVALKKITVAFTSSAYKPSNSKLIGVYLTNVPANTSFDLTAASTIWYNQMRRQEEGPKELFSDIHTYDLATSTYSKTFYSYPNPTVADAEGGSWTARHTRLVVETTIDGVTYYYPITLPVLEAGKSYEIENLTITRLGSTDPDKPVKLSDVSFEIKVNPWTVVPVTDGVTI